MSNEFRTISGNCDALVPRGPGYENIAMANQVCTAVGAQPGQAFVDGDTFLALTFTFSWSNTWRVSTSQIVIISILYFFRISASYSHLGLCPSSVSLFSPKFGRDCWKPMISSSSSGEPKRLWSNISRRMTWNAHLNALLRKYQWRRRRQNRTRRIQTSRRLWILPRRLISFHGKGFLILYPQRTDRDD